MKRLGARGSRGGVAVSALALVFAVCSCAGPQAKVTITGKRVALTVAFGKPTVPPTPAQPIALVPAPSGVGVVAVPAGPTTYEPTPGPSTSFTPPPAICPTPGPGTSVPEAAPSSTKGVPKDAIAAVHAVRSTTDGRGTITQKTVGYLATSKASQAPSGQSQFYLGLRLFGVDGTEQYQVVPPATDLPTQATTGLISLTAADANGGLGYQQSFHPMSPLQVFAQPAFAGESWTSTATDPSTNSVAQVNGKIIKQEAIAACDKLIDTWHAQTVVDITNPSQTIKTTVDTWFATQHGGLPVAQTQNYTGRAGGENVSGSTSWVVDVDAWAG